MQGLNAYGIGYVCFDPELRTTSNGQTVTDVRVAFNRGKDKNTLFMDFTAWGAMAEHCAKYFTKGKAIALDGVELEQEEYTDKEGKDVVKIKGVLRKFPGFVPGNGNGNSGGEATETPKTNGNGKRATAGAAKKTVKPAQKFEDNNVNEDDIPF